MTARLTTIAELDALPVGAVVLGDDGKPWQKKHAGWETTSRYVAFPPTAAGLLPATALAAVSAAAPEATWPTENIVRLTVNLAPSVANVLHEMAQADGSMTESVRLCVKARRDQLAATAPDEREALRTALWAAWCSGDPFGDIEGPSTEKERAHLERLVDAALAARSAPTVTETRVHVTGRRSGKVAEMVAATAAECERRGLPVVIESSPDDEYAEDPEWEYGFRMDGEPAVWSTVFGLPFTSLAAAQHAGDKSWTESIEYVRHPKGSRRDDDWEAIPDGR